MYNVFTPNRRHLFINIIKMYIKIKFLGPTNLMGSRFKFFLSDSGDFDNGVFKKIVINKPYNLINNFNDFLSFFEAKNSFIIKNDLYFYSSLGFEEVVKIIKNFNS